MKQILYATTNPGKLAEVQTVLKHHSLDVIGPQDLGLTIDVEESGSTLEENARLKTKAYLQLVDRKNIVFADDTGLEIDALGGEPGITVRRWKGYKMSDEEIISYTLERLKDIPAGKRGAQFHTVIAVGYDSQPIKYFHGFFRGEILETPRPERIAGMPFFPLFYLPSLKTSLGEFHELPIAEQLKSPTHRELAVLSALPYLRQLTRQP